MAITKIFTYDEHLGQYVGRIVNVSGEVDDIIVERPIADEGVMIVYDVETLPNGEIVFGKPYRKFPSGRIESI